MLYENTYAKITQILWSRYVRQVVSQLELAPQNPA